MRKMYSKQGLRQKNSRSCEQRLRTVPNFAARKQHLLYAVGSTATKLVEYSSVAAVTRAVG